MLLSLHVPFALALEFLRGAISLYLDQDRFNDTISAMFRQMVFLRVTPSANLLRLKQKSAAVRPLY